MQRMAAADDPRARRRRAARGWASTDLLGRRPQRAVGRPAPARGARPRDRARAAGVPDGRAAVEPRREAARGDARLHRAPAPGARHDDALRHARPGRGDDDGRPRRGHARRAPRAGRPRRRRSTTARPNLFVAELHRLAGHEPVRGALRSRTTALCAQLGSACPCLAGPLPPVPPRGEAVVAGIRPEALEWAPPGRRAGSGAAGRAGRGARLRQARAPAVDAPAVLTGDRLEAAREVGGDRLPTSRALAHRAPAARRAASRRATVCGCGSTWSPALLRPRHGARHAVTALRPRNWRVGGPPRRRPSRPPGSVQVIAPTPRPRPTAPAVPASPASRPASSSAPPPPPTRSRARRTRTARRRRSGTRSAARPGAIANGDTGDVACDHYHRWREDVALMAGLGLDAYRFSIAWPRVQPERRRAGQRGGPATSTTAWSTGCSSAGIEPVATLYHWDLPQALQDAGGWADRDTAERFAEYAQLVARRARRPGPALDHAQRAVVRGLPRLRRGRARARACATWRTALPAGHHLLLAHGLAVGAARRAPGAASGITLNLSPVYPAGDRAADATRPALLDGHAATAGSSTRCCAAPTRRTCVDRLRAPRRADRRDPRRRPRGRSPRRSTSSASTTTSASRVARGRDASRAAAGVGLRSEARRPLTGDGLGGRPGRPQRAAASGCSATTAVPHRRSPRTAPPSTTRRPARAGRRPRPRRLPRRPPRRRGPTRSPTAWTSAATSPGR